MLINRAPSNSFPVPQINTHIIFTSYNYHACAPCLVYFAKNKKEDDLDVTIPVGE
jgi:hypothetical protein